MPVTPTYPGVYVQEIPSGVRTIAGVSTSVGLFVGRTSQGPLQKPIRCLSYSDFERTFSGATVYSDMARYVKLFFLNGGTDCYVMRIANGATFATVTLLSETNADVLILTAKQAGLVGESIRAAVTYNGQQPEATFNITLFRWETNPAGAQVQVETETWNNLSMNPRSPLYAPDFLTQNSKLVDAAVGAGAASDPASGGFSQSGRPIPYTSTTISTLRDAWAALIGDDPSATANNFMISIDGSAFQPVDLSGINVTGMDTTSLGTFSADLIAELESAIEDSFPPGTTVTVTLETGPTPPAADGDASVVLRIQSDSVTGDVTIRPGTSDAAAVPLMLGTAQGGLEVSAYANHRPAPTGLTLNAADPANIDTLQGLAQGDITQINLPAFDATGSPITANITVDLVGTGASDPLYADDDAVTPNGNNDGIRKALATMRDAINNHRQANTRTFFWKAELWGYRLAILPTSGDDNEIGTLATATTDIATLFTDNVRYYSLGINGTAGQQTPALGVASDGTAPLPGDYDDAYLIADREIDLFNLLILPPDAEPAVAMSVLYGPASVFCYDRRAFLLMDPPTTWTTAQAASEGVDDMRVGLVKDYSAIFYPRLVINENGLEKKVGPAGAIGGLMARIDSSRGVWKAPAGTEADLRGIVGVEYRLSDAENGLTNPVGLNTIRAFPSGIVNWGARTNDVDGEYNYIPVRRTALFIEESLYRGLQWVVFEPNDEPLWAQIRLNVGAFMHDLFRKGAFQGQKPKDAYFVKCDSETTTQTDINLGIVNILVGFAPLKPAEFVILSIQQMAGQIET